MLFWKETNVNICFFELSRISNWVSKIAFLLVGPHKNGKRKSVFGNICDWLLSNDLDSKIVLIPSRSRSIKYLVQIRA